MTLSVSRLLLQCVQKPNQLLHPPASVESVDAKDAKLQEQDQRQTVPTPDSCPSARRAKRMKYEVGVVQEDSHMFHIGLCEHLNHVILNMWPETEDARSPLLLCRGTRHSTGELGLRRLKNMLPLVSILLQFA